MVEQATQANLIFLTGDLGFMALEPLRSALGQRFVNAGVAEQNMIGVAAGMARDGMRPWAYSIAPFIYARPFEQIRNDVCLHGLPVVMVGNGGGYGYGVMGATHHALEDYGTLLTLQSLRAFVPAFDCDIRPTVAKLAEIRQPAYLRLGLDEAPAGFVPPDYGPWRRLIRGSDATVVVCGPIAGGLIAAVRELPVAARPNVWLVSELPIDQFPPDFLDDVRESPHVVVVEEHVAVGGVGAQVARQLLLQGVLPKRFSHRCAAGYPSGRYGSQRFHRKECGLDVQGILASLVAPAGKE